MNREQQEMALWRCEYSASRSIAWENRAAEADCAVEQFRKRYPPQSEAPAAVWYDEPPFEKDGEVHYCWVVGCSDPQSVFWSTGRHEWNHFFACNTAIHRLAGRRVCPIVKPPEPPQ